MMPSNGDTSTDADRLRFTKAIEANGFCSVQIAQAVKSSPHRVTEITASSLDLPGGATFAQAAERVMVKHRNLAVARQAPQ